MSENATPKTTTHNSHKHARGHEKIVPRATTETSQETEAILHSFYDSAPMMMGVVEVFDEDIRHLSDNAATARFMGMAPGVTAGRLASELGMPLEHIQEWIRHYRAAERAKTPVRFEYQHHTQLGVRWMSATVSFIGLSDAGHSRCSYIAEDITSQKQALLNQQFVSSIDEKIRIITAPEDILWTMAQAVGQHLDVSRAHFNEVDCDADQIIVHHNYTQDTFSSEGAYSLSSFGSPEFLAGFHAGHILAISDVTGDERTAAAYETAYRPLNVRAFVAVPCMRAGKWVGTFLVDSSAPRQWTSEEVALLETVTQRTWLAVEAARMAQVARIEEIQRQQAQDALRESEQQLHLALHSARMGSWQLDLASGTLDASPTCKSNFGLSSDAPFTYAMQFAAIHPDDRTRVRESVRQALETKTGYHAEYRVLWPDGSLHWISAQGRLLNGENGQPARMIGTTQDITTQKRLEEERAYVMSGARCLLWYADIYDTEDPPCLTWEMHIPNVEAAQRFLPLALRPGQTYMDAWYRSRPQEDCDRCDPLSATAIREGRSYEQEFRCQAADGTLRWFHEDIHVETVEAGAHWRAISVCTEVTERVQHLQEIENLNTRLRRSIQETHHRVKNNLQIISALAELQIEEGEDTVPVTAMKRIGQHTRALAAIHDLLTQEAKNDVRIASISTQATLDKLIPLLQATTGGKHIRYQADEFRLPMREGASFTLLVSELVSNAVKHGRDTIELTLTVIGNMGHLQVCDDGPGFSPDFDWRKAANTGLGLIDSTGRYDLRGTISYENRLEGGARVVVIFPIPQAAERTEEERS